MKKVQGALVVMHGEPEHEMTAINCKAAKISNERFAKSPVSALGVVIASVRCRCALIEIACTNTKREIAMNEVKLGTIIGLDPFVEVGAKDWIGLLDRMGLGYLTKGAKGFIVSACNGALGYAMGGGHTWSCENSFVAGQKFSCYQYM